MSNPYFCRKTRFYHTELTAVTQEIIRIGKQLQNTYAITTLKTLLNKAKAQFTTDIIECNNFKHFVKILKLQSYHHRAYHLFAVAQVCSIDRKKWSSKTITQKAQIVISHLTIKWNHSSDNSDQQENTATETQATATQSNAIKRRNTANEKTITIYGKIYTLKLTFFTVNSIRYFGWVLVDDNGLEYLYNYIVERQTMSTLAQLVVNDKYLNDKMNLSENLKEMKCAIFVEFTELQETPLEIVTQALVEMECCYGIRVCKTQTVDESKSKLKSWTNILLQKLAKTPIKYNSSFFEHHGFMLFNDAKKTIENAMNERNTLKLDDDLMNILKCMNEN